MRLLLLALSCWMLSSPVLAKVYQYTDAHGNTVFTDNPPEQVDAKAVELPAVNSLPAPELHRTPAIEPAESEHTEQASSHYQLDLQLPSEEAIRANNGSFTLTVSIQPPLSEQHNLQLLVDGEPHGAASHSTQLNAHNLERGEHSIAVQVISGAKVIQQSTARIINVQRTHINAPARRARP